MQIFDYRGTMLDHNGDSQKVAAATTLVFVTC
jgi:hypothetical protein